MFEQISAILTDKKDKPFSYEELAAMLKTDPDALKTFDEVYKTQVLESGELHENMLQRDTATVKAILGKKVYFPPELNSLIDRIVTELVLETRLYIYNGLPLHTEYRVFVDFDTKEILGASPYWRSDVMKNEFKKVSSPQERHDYVVYKMHEDILNQRYHESVQTVLAELKKVIPRIELTGQWSVDVMRNGNDYYIIDMALAENSALNDCVPKNLLRAYPQQWLPGESNS